jgi:hypothetical protein
MIADRPFLRQISVYVWQFDETTSLPKGMARRYFADGTLQHYRIAFKICKSIYGTPNNSRVTMYNLSQASRASLQTPNQKVMVEAGWSTFPPYQLFTGGLYRAKSERHEADIVTDLIMLTGVTGQAGATTANTFSEGTPLLQILKKLVQQLPDVKFDERRISSSLLSVKIGYKGLTLAGRVKDLLDKLALQYGFSWSVQDGVFQALADGAGFAQNVISISTEDELLYMISPMLEGSMQKQIGVNIKAFLVPSVMPGDMVSVESSVSPHLSGMYKIHTISYMGDSHSNDWMMEIQSFKDPVSGGQV